MSLEFELQNAEHEPYLDGATPSNHPLKALVYSCPVDHEGTAVYVKGWRSPENHNHPVLFVHDLGENISMYRRTGRMLAMGGFNTYGFDLRGHGRSGRRLGHTPSFDQLVKDLLQVVSWVKHKEDGLKPILVGQGVGALIAMFFNLRFSQYVKGMVLLSPSVAMRSQVSKTKRLIINWLKELAPTWKIPSSLCPTFTCAINQQNDSQEKSILKSRIATGFSSQVGVRLTINFAAEILKALDQIDSVFLHYHSPTLLIHPEEDPVNDYMAVRQMIRKHHQNHHFIIKSLPNVSHHMLTESDEAIQVVLQDMIPWLKVHGIKNGDKILEKPINQNVLVDQEIISSGASSQTL